MEFQLEQLDFYTPDRHGFVPDPHVIGMTVTHTAHGHQFVITGFAWMASTDEWGFEHKRIGDFGPTITRPFREFCGVRKNGEYRFEEASDYAGYQTDSPEKIDADPLDAARLGFITSHVEAVHTAYERLKLQAMAEGDKDNESYWEHELKALNTIRPPYAVEPESRVIYKSEQDFAETKANERDHPSKDDPLGR